MTYQELKDIMNTMTEDDLKKEVIVLGDDFYDDVSFYYSDADELLEYGYPYLEIRV